MKIKQIFQKNFFLQKSFLITISVIFLCFLISLTVFLVKNEKIRRTFVFPSADEGKFCVETRFLSKNPVQGDIQFYVDELLLGPGIERTKMIFSEDTKVNSCFLRKNTLYLDLSEELLNIGRDVILISDGMSLLKKNIQINFPQIHEIVIFTDGKLSYESEFTKDLIQDH